MPLTGALNCRRWRAVSLTARGPVGQRNITPMTGSAFRGIVRRRSRSSSVRLRSTDLRTERGSGGTTSLSPPSPLVGAVQVRRGGAISDMHTVRQTLELSPNRPGRPPWDAADNARRGWHVGGLCIHCKLVRTPARSTSSNRQCPRRSRCGPQRQGPQVFALFVPGSVPSWLAEAPRTVNGVAATPRPGSLIWTSTALHPLPKQP